jgi:hypothetical protein
MRPINLIHEGRVGGPGGVGFHGGAVDQGLPKVIQIVGQDVAQLLPHDEVTGLVAHGVEVIAQSARRGQFQAQMLEPEFERDGFFEQEPGVLVFAAALEAAQHQEKIDHVGRGAGPAGLQFDLLQLELAQLQPQFGELRGLSLQELGVGQAEELFLFREQVEIFLDPLDDGGREGGDLMNLVEKMVQRAVERGEED